MKTKEAIRNILGAFSDGAVLFPLLALLTMKAGFSGFTIFWTTGVVYIVAALLFRVPMAVQPLKSIAIAAVSVGASFSEVRLSGMLLGLCCLLMCLLNVDRMAAKVPKSIIHELQAGLGIMLVIQGIKALGGWSALFSHPQGLIVLAGVSLMLLLPEVRGVPLLGLVATLGLLIAVLAPQPIASILSHPSHTENDSFRFGVILSLLLPQIVLTSANSVCATKDVCARYFSNKDSSVTVRKLLCSIGFGNLIVGALGGMPFCHGSGGVTAHVRGGSTKAWSTALLGVVLLLLAVIEFAKGSHGILYPPVLVSALLITTGFFHFKLSVPTLQDEWGFLKIPAAAIVTLMTQNLLCVVALGIFLEILESIQKRMNTISRVEVQR